jgi:very-short-patch-repair endonuclease
MPKGIYNRTKGQPCSEQTKKKISEANKGKPSWNQGKHLSEEMRLKLSQSHIQAYKNHPEYAKKISDSKKGSPAWNKGIARTVKEKQNISASLKGRVVWNKGKETGQLSEEHRKKIGNANKGKTLGRELSTEIKKKISEANKGRVSPLKGIPRTEEVKRKIGESHKGVVPSKDARIKISLANLGRKHSEESKRKISESHKGSIGYYRGKQHKKNISLSKKGQGLGKHLSEEHRKKISLANKNPSQETRQKMGLASIGRLMNHKYRNTEPELKFKKLLQDAGLEEKKDFIYQYYVKNIVHHYVADFYIIRLNMVIEIDGLYFHKGDRIERDNLRTREMMDIGYSVLRFTDIEINKHYDEVKAVMNRYLTEVTQDIVA